MNIRISKRSTASHIAAALILSALLAVIPSQARAAITETKPLLVGYASSVAADRQGKPTGGEWTEDILLGNGMSLTRKTEHNLPINSVRSTNEKIVTVTQTGKATMKIQAVGTGRAKIVARTDSVRYVYTIDVPAYSRKGVTPLWDTDATFRNLKRGKSAFVLLPDGEDADIRFTCDKKLIRVSHYGGYPDHDRFDIEMGLYKITALKTLAAGEETTVRAYIGRGESRTKLGEWTIKV